MRQIILRLNLGGHTPPVELNPNVKQQLVEVMAQAIVAVHQAAVDFELLQSNGKVEHEAEADDER